MSDEVRVPTLPESVNDATVLTWHKKPGDAVQRDETLVDLETDKVVLEVPAPHDGVLSEIAAGDGSLVKAGDLLARMEAGAPAKAAAAKPAAKTAPEAQAPAAEEEEPVLTPAVRRLVKELDLDTSQIAGSGKDGRILKADVMRYLDEHQVSVDERDADLAAETALSVPAGRVEKRVPMSRLRARIAERLKEAQNTAAILTTFNEVDLQAVTELRKRYRDSFEKAHGVRLGFMPFFVKAVVEALKRFPVVNASVDGNDILYHDYFDIGIAVSSERGLVVPILRDADQLAFPDIEATIRAFAKKAQDGTLSYEELNGGTFTITNGGVFGSMLSTPILNPPQSAILGMHNIVERPVVVNGEIVIRPMMYVALSYDHRIIDGREAVQFLVTVKQCLEDPARLLLQI
jgi:2-oxoglutarate dehydrogenase E2 component (dihydrolipoamide succinyltransferase)